MQALIYYNMLLALLLAFVVVAVVNTCLAGMRYRQGGTLSNYDVHSFSKLSIFVPKVNTILPLYKPSNMPPSRFLSQILPLLKYNRPNLQQQIRHQSTKPTAEATTNSRISRLEARLPRVLARYVKPLRNAPISHITAFLVLHELTAIIPLFGLTFAFHKFDWLPPVFSEGYWVKEGVEKFGRYFRRKGWIRDADGEGFEKEENRKGLAKWWPRGEDGVRLLVEVATAYAITKALLPLRLGLSLWFAPSFAKISTLPIKRWITRKAATKTPAVTKVAASPAAGASTVGSKVTK